MLLDVSRIRLAAARSCGFEFLCLFFPVPFPPLPLHLSSVPPQRSFLRKSTRLRAKCHCQLCQRSARLSASRGVRLILILDTDVLHTSCAFSARRLGNERIIQLCTYVHPKESVGNVGQTAVRVTRKVSGSNHPMKCEQQQGQCSALIRITCGHAPSCSWPDGSLRFSHSLRGAAPNQGLCVYSFQQDRSE